MRKRFLICFTGVDGSGKTTHAESVLSFLAGQGYSCSFAWGALRPILSYLFFGFTKLLGYWKETKENAYTDPLEKAPRKSIKTLGWILRFLFFIDFQMRTSGKIRLPLMLGRVVVVDRYFYDMLMELRRSGISSKHFEAIVAATVPKPVITFLLDAPESLIQERRGFTQRELESKRAIFLKMARIFNFTVIDSSKDFQSNQKEIQAFIVAEIEKCHNSGAG
jgi:thymidylate kinase